MSTILSIALAQLDFTVGDLAGNTQKVVDSAIRARDELDCKLIVYPELTLAGYPPEDLLLRPAFCAAVEAEVDVVCKQVQGITMIIGHPYRSNGALYNAASVITDGAVVARYFKHHLPNYSVFDEKRYFSADSSACVVPIDGVSIGITICEDIWEDGPMEKAVEAGAKLIVCLNASPFHLEKSDERSTIIQNRSLKNQTPIVYVNLVGGQDELVFDGGSSVTDKNGELVHRSQQFSESLEKVEFVGPDQGFRGGTIRQEPGTEESVYNAIVMGVRDYILKNGFSGAVLGLSGGIDSALTLAIAVDAIGADQVEALMMPSRYTHDMSNEDARSEAQLLGVECHQIAIEPMFKAFLSQLDPVIGDLPADTTEENLQARCRGVLLMAISNKKRKILLTTGNKSEMSVGYATLYGDMAGGFAAIKDVPKTLVYRLAHYRNSISPVIPERVIKRPPSAELAPDQCDQDSLPPYEILDPILERYIEWDQSPEEIAAAGFAMETVVQVARLVDRNEYKRRQAAPGVRITQKAFGRDRRYPITSRYSY